MADATQQPAITPSQQKALDIWDSLPETDRSYANVAKQYIGRNNEPITEGRAADYVRQGWTNAGREGSPTGGKRSTNRPTNAAPVVDDFEQQLKNMLDRNREMVDRLSTEIDDAQAALDSFNPDEFRNAEQERLDQAALEAQARADAFRTDDGDVATQAVQAEQERLGKASTDVTARNEKALQQAEAAVAKSEEMLALVSEQPSEQPA